jgi:hypothetical protein
MLGLYSGSSSGVSVRLIAFAKMGITYSYGWLGSLKFDELKRFAVARVVRIYPSVWRCSL